MKRFISLVIILVMLVPFAACRKAPDKEADSSPVPTETATEKPADPTSEPVIPTAEPTDGPDGELPKVFAGDDVFFILYPDGSLYGWGNNIHGQVGIGSTDFVRTPVYVADGLRPVYIGETVFALDSEGGLWGWGSNEGYALGLGDTFDRTKPEKILSGVTEFACLEDGCMYALTENGDLLKWSYAPWDDLTDYEKDVAGTPSVCYENVKYFDEDFIITRGGDLIKRWGDFEKIAENVSEVYGFDGWSTIYKGTDDTLYELRKVWESDETKLLTVCESVRTVIFRGAGHTYVLKEDGALYNYVHPFIRDQETEPQLIFMMDGVKELIEASSISEIWACDANFALKENGELWAWGEIDGLPLGRKDGEDLSVPALVAEDVRAVYTNGGQTYLILTNGEVWATGLNDADCSSIGAGAEQNGNVKGLFVKLAIENAAYIATRLTADQRYATKAGEDEYEGIWYTGTIVYARTFAVLKDGTILAWGYNGDGCLGAGSADKIVYTPSEVCPEGR